MHMSNKPSGYKFTRDWFDFSFENTEKIKPRHGVLYFFAIEQCNRLGWKKKFGFPADMAMEATGIRSYNTYSQTLKDLIAWGFITLIEKSNNQYSANIIALSNFDKAIGKALDKALITHNVKQDESIDSIDKPINNKPINNKPNIDPFKNQISESNKNLETDEGLEQFMQLVKEFLQNETESGRKYIWEKFDDNNAKEIMLKLLQAYPQKKPSVSFKKLYHSMDEFNSNRFGLKYFNTYFNTINHASNSTNSKPKKSTTDNYSNEDWK